MHSSKESRPEFELSMDVKALKGKQKGGENDLFCINGRRLVSNYALELLKDQASKPRSRSLLPRGDVRVGQDLRQGGQLSG